MSPSLYLAQVPMQTDGGRHTPLAYPAGDDKLAGGDVLSLPRGLREVWLLAGCHEAFLERPDPANPPKGSLSKASAHWWVALPEEKANRGGGMGI